MNSLAEIFPHLIAPDLPPRIQNWNAFCEGEWLVMIQTLKVRNYWDSLHGDFLELSKRSGLTLCEIPSSLSKLAPGVEIRLENLADTQRILKVQLDHGLALPVFYTKVLSSNALREISTLVAMSLEYKGPIFIEADTKIASTLRPWPEPQWTRELVLKNTPPRNL